ncbi:MAG: NAD(P)/FAD-dependent oxidoreductase [Muribaculaceae bacterium]|nr:NAD(P)/FAD-dependent oxidoreductase [Muribaculaceae bacterium]
MNDSTVIIGGGIGGLFTGAFLAKNDHKVTVLEKNAIIGGGLQCFHRKGKLYETGMHIMGGFEEGGSLFRICRYLGILDELDIHHIDSRCMDEIYYHSDGSCYRIASGREGFAASLAAYFPEEEQGIRDYIDCLFRITEEVPLFYLGSAPEGFTMHSELFTTSADRLIAHFVSNEKLREILAYLSPLYGGVKGHTPAYIHALINVLYINGASRFAGGSQQLADALARVIEKGGGRVLPCKEVCAIDIADRNVLAVHTADGCSYSAERYISSIHPVELLHLVPPGTFLRGFSKRLEQIPNSYSAFSLFIDLKPGSFPYIDHTCYYMDDFGSMWNQDSYAPDTWPGGFMYMTPPDRDQGPWASRMLVHCIMSFDLVRRWADTSVGRRGEEYKAWKAEHVERVLAKLERLFPDIRSKIECVHAASPLTVRDYYHTRDGAIFGYRKDCDNLMFGQLTVYTKVHNLFLTGQNINLHGICGVPLTAINTAEAILGKDFIIKRIHEACKNN